MGVLSWIRTGIETSVCVLVLLVEVVVVLAVVLVWMMLAVWLVVGDLAVATVMVQEVLVEVVAGQVVGVYWWGWWRRMVLNMWQGFVGGWF